jgi:two-component system sensor histidine kinase KdpD
MCYADADLEVLIQRSVSELSSLAIEKRVSILIDAQEGRLSCDQNLILQVLVNVLSNAIKYSPVGGRVWLVLRRQEKACVLTCEDEGPGLPTNSNVDIFNEFSRGEAHQSGVKGTGLGLAISKQIVKLHHGAISADNRKDGGARFTITLPTDHESAEMSQ